MRLGIGEIQIRILEDERRRCDHFSALDERDLACQPKRVERFVSIVYADDDLEHLVFLLVVRFGCAPTVRPSRSGVIGARHRTAYVAATEAASSITGSVAEAGRGTTIIGQAGPIQ